MKFRTKDLEKYLNKKLDWRRIAKELTLKSFESVYNDGILEVDILPNRYADASSIIGILKELKRIGQIKNFKEPKIEISKPDKKFSKIKIINQIPKDVPYYFGKVLLGLKNKQSPNWLKEFVEFYGFNSINFLVDLANFVMIEYGAPLHLFDLDKIKGNVFVRLARKGERFISLDGKEYVLNGEEVVIADEEKILALAGIKGSKLAEVTLETKNIFIESAIFNPEKIYATSRKLNLITTASFRFERKIAPLRSLFALERLSSLIQKDISYSFVSGILNYKKLEIKSLKFDFSKIEKILGFKIEPKKIYQIFSLLEIKRKGNYLILPQDRLDLNIEEDIVEEIIRIYGWNEIKGKYEMPLKESFVDKELKFNNFLKEILTKLGYNEAYTYNFISEEDKDNFVKLLKGKPVEVLNPLSENYKYFQFTLLPNLLKAVYLNQFSFREIRLFEIEKIGYRDKEINENYNLAVIFAFNDPVEILKELKGILRIISQELRINFEIREIKDSKIAEVFVRKIKVGSLGLISLETLRNYKIDLAVGFIELSLKSLIEFWQEIKKFIPLPVFPAVSRDLSFFMDEKIKFGEIRNQVLELKIAYLEKIELVDIYFDLKKPGKKSFTLRFVFRHSERSLQSEEIDEEMRKIERFLKEKFQAEIR